MSPTVDQDFSHSLGEAKAYGHYMFRVSFHTVPPSLYRSVKALKSYFQYHLVKWNLVEANRIHSPETGGVGSSLPLEGPKDREGNNTGEKHIVLMP